MCKPINAKIKSFGELTIPDQSVGNSMLNVMPFIHTGKYQTLPDMYKQWEPTFNKILAKIPLQEGANQHYITINSEFFTSSGTQRREGVHIDGNFCVDPNFVDTLGNFKASWGGVAPAPIETWSGITPTPGILTEQADNSHVQMDWVLPYDVVIPISKYVSNDKGGLFIVSSNVGSKAYQGIMDVEVGPEGSLEHAKESLINPIYVPKHELIFLTSNTPHETLEISAGERRTFMRLTLNHNYNNNQILKN